MLEQGKPLSTDPQPETIPLAYAVSSDGMHRVRPFFKTLGWLCVLYGVWQSIIAVPGVAMLYHYAPVSLTGNVITLTGPVAAEVLYGVALIVVGLQLMRRRPSVRAWLVALAVILFVSVVFSLWGSVEHGRQFAPSPPETPWYAGNSFQRFLEFVHNIESLIPAAASLLLARSRLLRGYLGVA
jgi:hypothetical protein